MKYILILILMLIPSLLYGGGVEDLRKAIDHEMQKVRYVPPKNETSVDRGKLLKKLNAYGGGAVGFRPVITILPTGISLSAFGVSVSADRRYVRIGVSPSFSAVGSVSTFSFRR